MSTRGGLRLDTVTVALVLALLLLGLIIVTSASVSLAAGRPDADPFRYMEGQLVMMLIGTAAAALLMCVPTVVLQKVSMPLLVVALLLLLLVLIPGVGYTVNGARRWLRLGGLNFQVSEFARVCALVYLASYAVRHEEALRAGFAGLFRPLALIALLSGLLLIEPDFGAASVLLASGLGLLYLAGARLRWVLALMITGSAGMALIAVLEPYRMRRLLSFIEPWAHAFDSGFQLTQSLIAIGRGEWFGVGLGASVQKLFYLPEAHTDFLFAVLAEELGLVGVVCTLVLFLALVWRVFYIARLAADAGMKFQSYLAAGFGLWLGVQAFINIGVNMGVLPTKGLTLPFMSYGRSSLIVTLAWLGMVLRVYHEALPRVRNEARPPGRVAAAAEVPA